MKFLFSLFLVAVCLIAPCNVNDATAAENSKLKIVVSIAPQKYFLEKLAGNHIDVITLVKPGSDPHSYEPSPAQMRQVDSAAFYFSIGVPFEDAWLPRMTNNKIVVSMIRDVERKHFANCECEHHGEENHRVHDHDHGSEDTHVWLSPKFVSAMLPVMVQTLSEALPEHKAEIEANAETFALELNELSAEIKGIFSATPVQDRVFLTFHPSWGYFAYEFELKEMSIEIDGKEPSPRAMKEVIDTAREFRLNTIFIEPQFPKASAGAIAENINATVVKIDPLAEDWAANLYKTARLIAESFKY